MHRNTKIRQARHSSNRIIEHDWSVTAASIDQNSRQNDGSHLLTEARAKAAESELQSLKQDLSEAALVQHLLNSPRELRRGNYEIACETFPIRQISGDFCTVFDIGNTTALALGDIAGKGLTAGMWFTHVVSLVRHHAMSSFDPAAVISTINRELCGLRIERPLITVFLAFLDWSENRLSYCRAGHPPPVVVRAHSGPELAHEGGPVLGVLPSAEFASGTITFSPGDGFLAYSDGLSELRNVDGDEFGIGRLLDEAQVCERFSAAHLLFSILGIAKDFVGDGISDDDITILALLRNNIGSRHPIQLSTL